MTLPSSSIASSCSEGVGAALRVITLLTGLPLQLGATGLTPLVYKPRLMRALGLIIYNGQWPS